MTDSVVVEGLVKIRDGKKWKSRWVVLRKPSPVADCLVVLVYKERGERASGQRERSSVTLEHIFGLEPGLPYEGLALGQSLTILCLSQSVALGFDCRETLQAWELRLRYSLGEVHRFGVGVLPGTKVETGPATLYLCNNLLVIARDLPPVIIGQWNLLDLRRYGPVTNGFVFEGGTRCGFWAGVFFLSCAEGEQISFLFDCIVRGISPSRGPFGLRPLLPDPNACPASVEERLNQEAQELEKRLSMLSHCSQHSTASTSSYSTSVAGDDRSISGSSDASDTSQSDSSIGSRLAAWADPSSGAGPAEAAGQSAGTRNAPLLADERQLPLVTLVGGTRLPGVAVGGASAKPARSRRGLQEIGRQSSSDSGIATGSHSSYSGSFSSYTSSLDVGVGSGGNGGGDDFGSVLSLPPAPHPLATPAGAATTPAERTLCTCPPCPGHEYQVPSSLRYLYDTPRSLLLGTAKGEGTGGTSSATEPQAGTSSQAEVSEDSKTGKPGRLSRGNSSEEAPPSEEVAEVCQICTPRAIFTACPICGGLKSFHRTLDFYPAGQKANEQSVTDDHGANQRTAFEATSGWTNPIQEKLPLAVHTAINGIRQKHGYLNHLSDLLNHYNMGGSSCVRTSRHSGYEPMASALVSISKTLNTTCTSSGKRKPSPSWKDTIVYENCFQCKSGESGCMVTGVNRRDRGRGGDALLAGRENCSGGSVCRKPPTLDEEHRGERGQAPGNQPKEAPPDLGITPVMGPHSDEVSHGSVDAEEDKKKQRCKADPSYEVMEPRTTERSSEVEEKSKYELMGSYGQQRLPHMDIEGGVFVFPADISMVAERPRVGDGVTYVNIPVSPTSKKQLNYMELELQETSASVRGRSSTKYAQIDITATETAHKVGTQHALGREEGLLKLEQKRRGGLPQ
ncbi:protein Dok-7-like [Alosa pseudoharengus]|uniref:protein Dok-7-like n=1 Tax=Alosa pseudoharengus TaxID=34774 RepID=UPI003F89DB53